MNRNRVYGGPPHQVIDGRFMDPAKLVNVLRSEYGQSNFRVEVSILSLFGGPVADAKRVV